MIERAPEGVHVAALPGGFGDHLADRRDQAGMVAGDGQLDALEARAPPGRAALAIGDLHSQDLAPPVPVDADRNQYRRARDDASLAHLLATGIEFVGAKLPGRGRSPAGFSTWPAGIQFTCLCTTRATCLMWPS